MLDEPTTDEERSARRNAQRLFLGAFLLGVLAAMAFALGLVPRGSAEVPVGVRAEDDSLIAKSGSIERRPPVREVGPSDDVRPMGVIEAGEGSGQGREVARKPTPVAELELAELLVATHHEVFGEAPTLARISVAWAHLALEHNRGADVANHNFGNVSVPASTDKPYYALETNERQRKNAKAALGEWRRVTMRFRAHPTAREGVNAYWRLLRDQYPGALKMFDIGNAHHAGRKLAELGYATAYAEPYAVSMSDLQGEFRARLFRDVDKLDVRRDFSGKLGDSDADAPTRGTPPAPVVVSGGSP